MNRTDGLVIAGVLLTAVILYLVMGSGSGKHPVKRLYIIHSGNIIAVKRLPAVDTYIYSSSGNRWVLRIEGDAMRVVESSCPQKICIKQGWIRKPNVPIICVPLKMEAVIRDGVLQDDSIDAITR